MKLIIAGSRNISLNPYVIGELMKNIGIEEKNITQVVSGGARGMDLSGEKWAEAISEGLPKMVTGNYSGRTERVYIKIFEADWDTHGKAAGPIRNRQMAEYADALLLIWDGESKGSANMLAEMKKLKKPVYEVILRRS